MNRFCTKSQKPYFQAFLGPNWPKKFSFRKSGSVTFWALPFCTFVEVGNRQTNERTDTGEFTGPGRSKKSQMFIFFCQPLHCILRSKSNPKAQHKTSDPSSVLEQCPLPGFWVRKFQLDYNCLFTTISKARVFLIFWSFKNLLFNIE